MHMKDIQFVDENDIPIGQGSKVEANANGIVHRVVRVIVINSNGDILLQKRGDHVVNHPGKWDQSVGGHVDAGETYLEAAYREMKEEVGIEDVELTEVTKYFTEVPANPPQRRFNMLYSALYDGVVSIDNDEVSDSKWVTLEELEAWITRAPDELTGGLIYAYEKYKEAGGN